MKPTRNTILLAVSIVIVLGGGFYYFFVYDAGTEDVLTTDTISPNTAEISFLTLVSKLDPIVFDTSLLSDPRFTSKQNIRTTVLPETTGRKDPFATLGR